MLLDKGCAVVVKWEFGHRGLYGNEKASEMTQKGALTASPGTILNQKLLLNHSLKTLLENGIQIKLKVLQPLKQAIANLVESMYSDS